jgi:hypothetical protein
MGDFLKFLYGSPWKILKKNKKNNYLISKPNYLYFFVENKINYFHFLLTFLITISIL